MNLEESNEGLMGVFSDYICIDHARWSGSQGPLLCFACVCVYLCVQVCTCTCVETKSQPQVSSLSRCPSCLSLGPGAP